MTKNLDPYPANRDQFDPFATRKPKSVGRVRNVYNPMGIGWRTCHRCKNRKLSDSDLCQRCNEKGSVPIVELPSL